MLASESMGHQFEERWQEGLECWEISSMSRRKVAGTVQVVWQQGVLEQGTCTNSRFHSQAPNLYTKV